MNDLYNLLDEDALQLSSEFRKASIQGKGTSQEVAEFRENAVQAFFGTLLSLPTRIAKGKVRDLFGNIAASIDCVICAPNHPYTVSARDKFSLLLAEGVDSVVEVKPNIADKAELHRALEQGLTVKKLRRSCTSLLDDHDGHPMSGWAKRVPFGVFAMQCKASPIETGFEILEFYQDRSIEPIDQADFVVVNDVCVFSNFVDKSLNYWNMAGFPNQTGWFYEGWGTRQFGWIFIEAPPSSTCRLKLQEDVLPRYLTPPTESRFRVVDLAFKHGLYKQLRSQPGFDAADIQRALRALTEEN